MNVEVLAGDVAVVTGSELVVDGGLTADLDHSLEQAVYDVDEVPTR